MDFLGGEKSSVKNEPQTEEYQAKPESVTTEQMTSSVQPGGDSERYTTNSALEKKAKSDFSQAFSLFSKYFRENGGAKAVIGLGEKPNPGNANEDVKGSNLASDENMSRPLGLFPQQSGFGSFRPVSGADPKTFAPAAAQPWPFRGIMPPNSQAFRPVSASSPAMKPPTAQLTIFYAGMVNVFDDVPADKAQAIMLLADSGNPMNNGFMKPAQQNTGASLLNSSLSSMARTSLSLQTSCVNKEVPSTTLPLTGGPNQNQPVRKLQSDLPIARKHSLQRFLEKRKDRLTTKAPYTTSPGGSKSEVEEQLSGSVSPLPPSCQSAAASLTPRTLSACCNETSAFQEASPSAVSANIS